MASEKSMEQKKTKFRSGLYKVGNDVRNNTWITVNILKWTGNFETF